MTNSDNSDARDEGLIASITPDVMKVLSSRGFFRELDNRLCPQETSGQRDLCHGNYQVSESILRLQGFDRADVLDILEVLRAKGAFCDCEILYNAVETSRLKAEYWRSKTERTEPRISHGDSK